MPRCRGLLEQETSKTSGVVISALTGMAGPAHGLQLALVPQPCSVSAIPLTPLTFRVRDGIVEVDRGALRRKRSPGGPV